MALTEYTPGAAFPGRMGRTVGESQPAWPAPLRAREGAPNVLFIGIDDTGFGQLVPSDGSFDLTLAERVELVGWGMMPSGDSADSDQRRTYDRSRAILRTGAREPT
jgi:hypothetical protein